MELVATWWPAALAVLVCLVLAWLVALLSGMDLDDEVGDSTVGIVLWVVMIGAPIIAAVLVGPSPDLPTALVGVLAVVAGLGAYLLCIVYLTDRYLGPAWKGTRTRSRVRVVIALSLGAAIAAILVLGRWLPATLGMTTALVATGAAVLVELGIVAAELRREMREGRTG